MDKYGNVEEDTVFFHYIECLRELVAYLIIESYDVAAYVYQKYCVEKLSLEEIIGMGTLVMVFKRRQKNSQEN